MQKSHGLWRVPVGKPVLQKSHGLWRLPVLHTMTTAKQPSELETYLADISTTMKTCFDELKFDHTIEYVSKECINTYGQKELIDCIEVYVAGLKGIKNFQIRRCLYFSIVPQQKDGRKDFKTHFWVQVNWFRTCAPRKESWYDQNHHGHVDNLMRLMIEFTTTLDEIFRGEFRLQVLHDTTSWEENNNFDGIDMRLLYVLEHGQSRLNQRHIKEPQYDKNMIKLVTYFEKQFTLQLPQEMLQAYFNFTNLMELRFPPTNKQLFVAVAERLRTLNDAFENKTFGDENKIEIDLFKNLLAQEGQNPIFKDMFKNLLLKQEDVVRKTPHSVQPLLNERFKFQSAKTPLAEIMSDSFYGSAFPQESSSSSHPPPRTPRKNFYDNFYDKAFPTFRHSDS